MLTFQDLYFTYKNLIRKKLWFKLDNLDKAFFLSCLKLSKIKKIFNKEIIYTLKNIIKKVNGFKNKIIKKGKEVAMNSMNGNVAKEIKKLKHWLLDPNYQFWLGLALS
jgi:hypothetical protein